MTTRHLRWWMAAVMMAALMGVAAPAMAQDYVVTFLTETYKDQGGQGEVYHTWAVGTDFGNKLLILTGKDMVRRQWLRDFAKDHSKFLLSVPEKDTGAFELNQVFTTDVTRLHPIDENFLGRKGKKRRR